MVTSASDKRMLVSCCLIWMLSIFGARPAWGGAVGLIVDFHRAGQMCLDPREEQQLTDTLKQLAVPARAALSLVAYSDRAEMRMEGWREDLSCIKSRVPLFIVDHGRVAVFRALAFLEVARRVRPDVFAREVAIHLGSGAALVNDPSVISIVPKRGEGTSSADRRVELRWQDGPVALAKNSTESGTPLWVLNLPLQLSSSMPPVAETRAAASEHSWTRPVAIIGLAMGVAGLGAGTGLLIRADQLDYSASIVPSGELANVYENQSHNLFVGGVVGTALGAGLGVMGVVFLALPRANIEKTSKSSVLKSISQTLRVSPQGIALSF